MDEGSADKDAAEEKAPDGAGSARTVPAVTEAAEAAEAEDVGIPQQQSAGEAVDNEAGKGART
ncbi:gliding motility protein [Streptomyces sp. NPDC006367]|uniref:gliding motility protein n=1 Tax=unclassified Streptomyces TaxID=2593676 RepID=UPI0033A48A9B